MLYASFTGARENERTRIYLPDTIFTKEYAPNLEKSTP